MHPALKATLFKGVSPPAGYAILRIGTPTSYQTPRVGSDGSARYILIPVGA